MAFNGINQPIEEILVQGNWRPSVMNTGPLADFNPQPMDMNIGDMSQVKRGGGFKDILGILGDSLLAGSGGNPIYAPRKIQQQTNEAFGQWMNNPQDQEALQNFLSVGGDKAIAALSDFMKANKPERPTGTAATYQLLLEKLGEQGASEYLENIASGPPVAVDVSAPDGSVTRQFLPRQSIRRPVTQQSGPQPGAIVNGFRFNGGNPYDQNSWSPVGGDQ